MEYQGVGMTTTRRAIAALAVTAGSLLLAQPVAVAAPTITVASAVTRCPVVRPIPLPAPGHPSKVTPWCVHPHHHVRLIPMGTPHLLPTRKAATR